MADDAVEFGKNWYAAHYEAHGKGKDDNRLGGYIARKQTHIHKLAMILSAARGSSMIITLEDLTRADKEVTALEASMPQIFDRIGKSETSTQTDRLLEFIRQQPMGVPVAKAYGHVHNFFPKVDDFNSVLKGLKQAGMVKSIMVDGIAHLSCK
jgi:hypothetical protein